jgi:hypothetical protein
MNLGLRAAAGLAEEVVMNQRAAAELMEALDRPARIWLRSEVARQPKKGLVDIELSGIPLEAGSPSVFQASQPGLIKN